MQPREALHLELLMLSYAFFNAPPLPRAPRRRHLQPLTCSRDTVILIPDHFSRRTPPWYQNLQALLPETYVHLLQMPNPYESNTKRWESVWLQVMRKASENCIDKASLLGHGTGADACLRFLEFNAVDSGVVLLAPTADEYFAGERHGRPYHWNLIRANIRAGLVLVTSATMDRTENQNLVNSLQPTLVHDLSKKRGRYSTEGEANEVAQFVRCANLVEI